MILDRGTAPDDLLQTDDNGFTKSRSQLNSVLWENAHWVSKRPDVGARDNIPM